MQQTIIYSPCNSFTHHTAEGSTDEFEIHTANYHVVLAHLACSDPDRICDIRFTPGFFQSFLVRFQVGEMKEIFGTNILKEDIIFIIVAKNLEIFITANPVMVTIFRTYNKT